MTNIVETIAHAAASGFSVAIGKEAVTDEEWPLRPDEAREMFDTIASTILTALEANGYAIVPCEPTREMIIAGETAAEDVIDWTQDSDCSYRTDEAYDFPLPVYRAMISTGKAKA